MSLVVLWAVTPFSLVGGYRHFRRKLLPPAASLHPKDRRDKLKNKNK
jgi:hypothetical protein